MVGGTEQDTPALHDGSPGGHQAGGDSLLSQFVVEFIIAGDVVKHGELGTDRGVPVGGSTVSFIPVKIEALVAVEEPRVDRAAGEVDRCGMGGQLDILSHGKDLAGLDEDRAFLDDPSGSDVDLYSRERPGAGGF